MARDLLYVYAAVRAFKKDKEEVTSGWHMCLEIIVFIEGEQLGFCISGHTQSLFFVGRCAN